jgi:hypothetical protein
MEINFRNIESEMDNLVRLYMVFGEEPFTFEEAKSITEFSPTLIKFLRDYKWICHLDDNNEPSQWKITYNGARMSEIYMELKSERDKTEKTQTTLF